MRKPETYPLVVNLLLNKELNAFTVPIRITNLTTRQTVTTYCIFDTGFTGYFGLTSKTIEDLKLEKIGEGKAVTITGDIEYANYLVEAEILDNLNQSWFKFSNSDPNPKRYEDKSTIPVQVFRLPLIGIRAIEQLNWMILAEKHVLCVLM